jgi:hypothetical protein
MTLLDAAGRRRSPATLRGYHAGRRPRNKGVRYPADAPTIDEIVAVMRHTADERHGWRRRAMSVVLWRAGLRIHEALALIGHDLDARRGSLLVRHGTRGPPPRGRDGRVGWSTFACGWTHAPSCRSGRCSASSTARRADGRGRAPLSAASSGGSQPRRASGARFAPHRCATRTHLNSRARACR